MTIHLKRLDFSSTVSAMICVCMRHAVTADGATQQALDEIAANLNNVAAIVGRRRLAPMLDGPIPPVPVPQMVGEEEEEGDEGELEVEPEVLVSKPERKRTPLTIFHDLNADGQAARLSLSQSAILEYIRANPGCTGEEISKATGYGVNSVNTAISVIRKSTPVAKSKSSSRGVSSYRVGV